jgi:uncharacterized damage-inducible protein DinB
MALVDTLLPEFDHEMTLTRKVLERVPDDRFAWKPHTKSYAVGQLAQHLATIPLWGTMTMSQAEVDLASFPPPPVLQTRSEILALFDGHAASARAALAGKSDAELKVQWALKRDGHVIFSMPKQAVWRSFVISHLIHHRAQLGVYLRLLDVPVPSTYGPSADEGGL